MRPCDSGLGMGMGSSFIQLRLDETGEEEPTGRQLVHLGTSSRVLSDRFGSTDLIDISTLPRRDVAVKVRPHSTIRSSALGSQAAAATHGMMIVIVARWRKQLRSGESTRMGSVIFIGPSSCSRSWLFDHAMQIFRQLGHIASQ